jgi:hypothetical protein
VVFLLFLQGILVLLIRRAGQTIICQHVLVLVILVVEIHQPR